MTKTYFSIVFLLVGLLFAMGCKKKIKQQQDELYSRHLQRKVKLTIISTPMPGNKSSLNLLLLNDGQDMQKLRVKEIADSLYKMELIQPLIIVGIDAGDRTQESRITSGVVHSEFGTCRLPNVAK